MMGFLTIRGARAAMLAGVVVVAAGCDSEMVIGPPHDDDRVLTVDADERWAYVRLGVPPSATEVQVSDPAASTAWDFAFNATRVMLNGGAAGPGDVRGYCLCGNADATDADVRAMTPESELAAFEAVTAASIPSDASAWETDALDPAIADWYTYDITTHTVVADPTRVWKLRGAGSSPHYAKLHVIDIADATMAGGLVTLEFAVQASADDPFGAVQAVVLDGRAGPVYFDFATGSEGDADDWDIVLDGFTIRINGGVSGSGGAAAVLDPFQSFHEMASASDAQGRYRGDAYGGVFSAHPWYRYNLDGAHTIFPTYDVYLIDTGERVYKVQVIGYYSVTGQDRHVSFRYGLLD